MQRRANFRSPLLGLERLRWGPKPGYRSPLRRVLLGVAVVAFLLVDAFLVVELVRDDGVQSSARAPLAASDIPGTSTSLQDPPAGQEPTQVAALIVPRSDLPGIGTIEQVAGRKSKPAAGASDAGVVVSTSTSITYDTGGSSSTGSSSSTGGSTTGGSDGSDSGGSDSDGSGSGGSGSDGSGSDDGTDEGGPGGGGP